MKLFSQFIMNIAVIGSRDFSNLLLVWGVVGSLPSSDTVISGGARGVDRTAARAARWFGLRLLEILPDFQGLTAAADGEYTRRYYARNQRIVNVADRLIAFTDRGTGATWDTIRRAQKKGIPISLYNSHEELRELSQQLSFFRKEKAE